VPATELRLSATTEVGLYGTNQLWDTQTWGTGLTLTVTTGNSAEDTSQAVTFSFRGQMTGTTTDTVALRNFTVIRYPAQVNP
jgi:hypothetical protein